MNSILSERVDFMILIDLNADDAGHGTVIIPVMKALVQGPDCLMKAIEKIDKWISEVYKIDPSRMHTFITTALHKETTHMKQNEPRWWDKDTTIMQLETIIRQKEQA